MKSGFDGKRSETRIMLEWGGMVAFGIGFSLLFAL